MKEKFLELCKDPEFVKKLSGLKSEKEVVDFLNQSGIQVKSAAELKAMVQPDPKSLDPKELEQVAGGAFCAIIGLGFDATACISTGASARDDSTEGIGFSACAIVGAGIGATFCGSEGR